MNDLTPNDEQAKHEAFEKLVGGPDRGFRLLRIYASARAAASGNQFTLEKRLSQEQLFRQFAKRDHYTEAQINTFLALQ